METKKPAGKNTATAPSQPYYNVYATYPDVKRLRFILDVFHALQLTPNSYARLTPTPASTSSILRAQLNADDMKVSKAKEIFSNLGLLLGIEFVDKEPPKETGYTITIPEEILRRKDELMQEKYNYENIGFLWKFMQERNLSKRQLSRDIGLTAGAVFTWFKSDDIAISHLYTIKDAYGVELHFSVKTK